MAGYVSSHFSGCSCHADITVGGSTVHTLSLVGRPTPSLEHACGVPTSSCSCKKEAEEGFSINMWALIGGGVEWGHCGVPVFLVAPP